jgi:hypothetical protein
MGPTFLLSGIGMMVVGLLSIIYWRRRTGTEWWFFLIGAMAWIVGVGLKSLASIRMDAVISFIQGALPKSTADPCPDSREGDGAPLACLLVHSHYLRCSDGEVEVVLDRFRV